MHDAKVIARTHARIRALARQAAKSTGAKGQVLRHLTRTIELQTHGEIERRIAAR